MFIAPRPPNSKARSPLVVVKVQTVVVKVQTAASTTLPQVTGH